MNNPTTTSFLRSELAGLNVSVAPEVTRAQVVDAFLEQLDPIVATLEKKSDQLPPELLETDAAAVEAAITELIQLGRDGILLKTDRNDPNSPEITYHYTLEMATRLDALIDTLKLAGATIDATGATPVVQIDGEALRRWLDFSLISPVVEDVVAVTEKSTENATRSLQSMIELEYVKTGNELISQKMVDLEESLDVTRGAMNVLGDIQDLHNQAGIPGAGQFSFPFTGLEEDFLVGIKDNIVPGKTMATNQSNRRIYVSRYISAAEEFFGESIDPEALTEVTFPMEAPDGQTFAVLLERGKEHLATLNEQIAILTPIAGEDSEIVTRLTTVRDDLALATSSNENFNLWITDNFGRTDPGNPDETIAIDEESGRIQQNISFAISAGQAFNDTQKEEVRRFMFVFEEYYKSASAILSKISQIIEKIAQGINR